MIRLIAALVLLCTNAASAQTLPAFYDVVGVEADDVLNVRATPSADGELVGILAPDAKNIEVTGLSSDGHWASVNTNETSGWTSLRYLTIKQEYAFLPMAHLTCFGTEPFWNLDMPNTGMISLSLLGEPLEQWRSRHSHRSSNRTDRFSVIAMQGEGDMVITLARGQCSDGMSDRSFGIAAEVIRPQTEPNHLSGCCSIQP